VNCEQAREACVLFAIPTPLDAHDYRCKGEALVAWSHIIITSFQSFKQSMKTHPHHHRQTSWIIIVPTTHTHYFLLWSLMHSTSRFYFWVKTHYGGRARLLSHCIVFQRYMFELQPCQYYERFSECFVHLC